MEQVSSEAADDRHVAKFRVLSSYNPHFANHDHSSVPPTLPSISPERPSFDQALQKSKPVAQNECERWGLLRGLESLHIGEDEAGNAFVRGDIIQYLRAREGLPNLANTASREQGKEIRGISSSGGVDGDEILRKSQRFARTTHSYEAFRSFIADFANFLFPWAALYLADHMTLHTQLKKGDWGTVFTAGESDVPNLGESDLGENHRSDFEALTGWSAKPFAILLSGFREVMFIDEDSLFFRDPAVLFEDHECQRTEALFFHDRVFQPGLKKDSLKQIMPQPVPKLEKQSYWWTGEVGHVHTGDLLKNKVRRPHSAAVHYCQRSFIVDPRLPRGEGEGDGWVLLEVNVFWLYP
ncbi:hypothetical protein F4775DRAFT_589888 [Biscogniauxia sp. FL1348]|nr:hypothetical protein F4775DRAFT_589888 [Biscogniauxia sp. FL1348]